MSTRRVIQSVATGIALTFACASVALGASAALAASPKSTAASAPVEAAAGGPVDVQIWPGQAGKTAVITVVEVDAKTKLPVTVRVPVTPGTTVEWAGEILGGPAASDIEAPFKLIQGQGGQFAEFTLTQSRRGQVDAIGFPLEVSEDMVLLAIEYVQSVSSPLTAMSVRLPANISKAKISPKPTGDPVNNADGESLYTIEPRAFKPGEKQTITISYSTIPPVEAAPGSEMNPVLIGLGIALAVAVLAMVIVVRRQAAVAPAAAPEGDDDLDADADEPVARDDDRPFDDDDSEPDLDFK